MRRPFTRNEKIGVWSIVVMIVMGLLALFVTLLTDHQPASTTDTSALTISNTKVLTMTVFPSNIDMWVWFEYGTSTLLGSSTPPQNIGTGTGAYNYSDLLEGLSPNTLYYYRGVEDTSYGVTAGSIASFTTDETIRTGPGSGIVATLSGWANPNGADTWAWFEYGTSTQLGSSTSSSTPHEYVGNGDNTFNLSYVVTDLLPQTTYYWRIVAENSNGSHNGKTSNFTTGKAPQQ